MVKDFNYLVFIGRFQPFHMGHKTVVNTALARSERVILLVGSNNSARSYRNPWSFFERSVMIRSSFTKKENERIILVPLDDYTYNDQEWITAVRRLVAENISNNSNNKIGLIGCHKDNTSYYLKLFPDWESIGVDFVVPLNSTDIRERYFLKEFCEFTSNVMPHTVLEYLKKWKLSEEYHSLVSEYLFIQSYKKQWESAPYPPVFVTVDAIVIQSGHVLLVRRRAAPGKGMWAIPGGFVNQDESLDSAVVRELKEETGLKTPPAVIKGSIREKKVFDDPNRSARGRTITQAYLIVLPPQTKLEKVKGGDDADKAAWVPLSELNPKMLFEDHYHIIHNMVNEL